MKQNDDMPAWMRGLTVLQAFRAGGAESQIHSREEIGFVTRAFLVLVQGLIAFACLLGTAGGVWFATAEILRYVGQTIDLASFLMFWIVTLAVPFLAKEVLGAATRHLPRWAQVAAGALVWLAAGVAVFAGVQALADPGGAVEPWRIAVGFIGALVSLAVAVNQLRFIDNPYWPTSPFEQGVLALLTPLFYQAVTEEKAPKPPVRQVDPRPLLVNGHGRQPANPALPRPHRPGWRAVQTPDDERFREIDEQRWREELARHGLLDEQELDEEPEEVIAPDVGNLVWFALYVSRLADLRLATIITIEPPPLLPFKEGDKWIRLGERWARRLLARGSTEGEVVDVDGYAERPLGPGAGWWHLGGQGRTPAWAKSRKQIRDEALALWHGVMDGEPPPDYWADLYYRQREAETEAA